MYCRYSSPLGELVISGDDGKITGLSFVEAAGKDEEEEEKSIPVFDEAIRWLDVYFSGRDPGFTPPLEIDGSDFRKSVCEIMLSIPFGHVMTYSEIAGIIAGQRGIPHMSPQAVGQAVGHNPVPIIIPCHRVIGAGGNLTGYSGGIWRKVRLLEIEGIETSKFIVPRKGTAI